MFSKMAPNYLVDRPKNHGSVQYYLIALQSQLGSHQFPLSLPTNLPIHLGWEHTISNLKPNQNPSQARTGKLQKTSRLNSPTQFSSFYPHHPLPNGPSLLANKKEQS